MEEVRQGFLTMVEGRLGAAGDRPVGTKGVQAEMVVGLPVTLVVLLEAMEDLVVRMVGALRARVGIQVAMADHLEGMGVVQVPAVPPQETLAQAAARLVVLRMADRQMEGPLGDLRTGVPRMEDHHPEALPMADRQGVRRAQDRIPVVLGP